MKKTEAIRIEEMRARQATIDGVLDILKQPVVASVIGYALVEGLQKAKIMPDVAGTVLEGGIIAYLGAGAVNMLIPG